MKHKKYLIWLYLYEILEMHVIEGLGKGVVEGDGGYMTVYKMYT